jgi:ferredoxin
VAEVFAVRIEPLGRVIDVPADQTLLSAALGAGVVLPSSCRNGTCRTCMCLATSGRVAYRIPWPGLSAEEKREGYVLPCVAHPDSALTLQVPFARPA